MNALNKPSGSDDWETVHTVNDYYDGPRAGVADFRGVPHVYRCGWNATTDDWDEVFTLSPIDLMQFRLVEEDWRIWRRWKAAHDAGRLGEGDDHPALACDRKRHQELQEPIRAALAVDARRVIQAVPEFRGTMEPTHTLEVRWSQIRLPPIADIVGVNAPSAPAP